MEGNARTSHEPERQHARQSSPNAAPPAAYPRKSSPNAAPPAAFPRKSSPNAAPPAAFPRKSSPNAPENSVFQSFWACRANFFALTHTSGHAGRTFSRTGHSHVPTLKPMTPLQPLMQASMKPPAPLRALNTRKTNIFPAQRRHRFQANAHTRSQRRHRFHHSEAMH